MRPKVVLWAAVPAAVAAGVVTWLAAVPGRSGAG